VSGNEFKKNVTGNWPKKKLQERAGMALSAQLGKSGGNFSRRISFCLPPAKAMRARLPLALALICGFAIVVRGKHFGHGNGPNGSSHPGHHG
jgi:hypothetical protein